MPQGKVSLREMTREVLLASYAIGGVVVAVITCIALKASPGTTIAATFAAAILGTAATGVAVGRRAVRLVRLEREARRIAAISLTDPSLSSAPALSTRGGTDELAPLRSALGDLGRRISAQLKETAKKTRNLEALIDAIDEPVLATDNADAVLLCNRAAETIFGAAPGTLIGRPVAELITQADLLDMVATARKGQIRRGRVRVVVGGTGSGSGGGAGVPRTFQVSACPVPAAWGDGVFGAVVAMRDVTEMDQAVQVRTDFVANASHELRTPVAAIRGAAETLREVAGSDPEMSDRLVRMVLTHALRLEEMLRDLLDLSRLESPDVPLQIARLDLSDLAVMLAGSFEDAFAKRRLRLECEFDEELRTIETDIKLLVLILRNLVENAAKFAYEDSTIRVTAALVEAFIPPAGAASAGVPGHGRPAAAAGRSDGSPSRGVIRFEVIDRGIGIPMHLQERVFERYFQVDTARTGPAELRGTGLGLAIVKHAAKALGGRVGISSVHKEGTTAWVEVPVVLPGEMQGGTMTAAEVPSDSNARA